MARKSREDQEGWDARMAGVPNAAHNPYSYRDQIKRMDWEEGFNRAGRKLDEDARKRQAQMDEDERLRYMPASYKAHAALARALGSEEYADAIKALIEAMIQERHDR